MFGIRSHFSLVFLCACLSLAAVKVSAAAPAPGTQIDSAVTLSYTTPDDMTPRTVTTNVASFLVGQIAGVTVTPRAASQTVTTDTQPCTFPLVIHNTGTGRDQFEITATAPFGWTASLVLADRKTPITSPLTLDADQTLACAVIVGLPKQTDGSTQKTVVRVTSQADATVSAEADLSVTTPTPTPIPDTTLRVGWAVRTGGPVLGGAVVWNGTAFVGSDDGYLYAITATGVDAGTVAWRFNTGSRVRCTPAVYAVPDGRMLLTVGNDAGTLTTLDATTGQPIWARQAGGGQTGSWRSQPQVTVRGALVTVPDNQGYLCSYSTVTGALLQRFPWAHWFLIGDPAASGPDGRGWLMTTSGWGNEVLGGLPGRSLRLPLPTLSGLTLDATADSLLGVSADGHVFSYDSTTLNPNPRWGKIIKAATPPAPAQDLNPASFVPRPVPISGISLGAAVDASPALDPSGGTLYVGAEDHKVYAIGSEDGSFQSGWPFVPGGLGHFLAKPLAWPTAAGGATTLYLGDTEGVFYAIPTDHPNQPLSYVTRSDENGLELFGEWDAAPAASGTTANDVVVVGNTNGIVYGFQLR